MKISEYLSLATLIEKNLPFYIATIGNPKYQPPVHRPLGIEDYQLLYTLGGEGCCFINGKSYTVRKPSISPLTETVSKAFLTLNRPFCRPIRSLNSQTAIKNYIFSKTIPKCSNKQASSFILCCWRCVNSQRRPPPYRERKCIL